MSAHFCLPDMPAGVRSTSARREGASLGCRESQRMVKAARYIGAWYLSRYAPTTSWLSDTSVDIHWVSISPFFNSSCWISYAEVPAVPSRYRATTLPNSWGWTYSVPLRSARDRRSSFRRKVLASTVLRSPPEFYLWSPVQTIQDTCVVSLQWPMLHRGFHIVDLHHSKRGQPPSTWTLGWRVASTLGEIDSQSTIFWVGLHKFERQGQHQGPCCWRSPSGAPYIQLAVLQP